MMVQRPCSLLVVFLVSKIAGTLGAWFLVVCIVLKVGDCLNGLLALWLLRIRSMMMMMIQVEMVDVMMLHPNVRTILLLRTRPAQTLRSLS
ncbi:MAG: hypothetical protein J3Q66DRAFT_351242 [Benniella sp.]|nr:MAG: hypothetical protein J3Q66DRAFT_351242 [Benniella sp.]